MNNNESFYENIKENVLHMIKVRGLTLDEFCEKVGTECPKEYWLDSAHYSACLAKMAKVLEVKLDELCFKDLISKYHLPPSVGEIYSNYDHLYKGKVVYVGRYACCLESIHSDKSLLIVDLCDLYKNWAKVE